jgi:hypothetical protein
LIEQELRRHGEQARKALERPARDLRLWNYLPTGIGEPPQRAGSLCRRILDELDHRKLESKGRPEK